MSTKNYDIVPYKNYFNVDLIKVDDIVLNHHLDNMNTGDLILFSGRNSIISSIIKWWTNSFYSHIGIVFKNPYVSVNGIFKELRGIYLLESGYESIPDAIDNVKKYGVQIVPLRDVIEHYNGAIFWRKLNLEKSSYSNDNLNFEISKLYTYIKNKSYDLNIIDLLSTNINLYKPNPIKLYNYSILNWFRHDTQKQDRFVCSALVAYVYSKLGFLPQITHWTECVPKFFSNENNKLKLLEGVFLENEKKIK